MSDIRHFLANCAPGIAWVIVGQPFDVVQVRLQTTISPAAAADASTSSSLSSQPRQQFRGAWHCLRSTVAREGILALWKGGVPQVLLSVPYASIMFTTYQWLKPASPPLGSHVTEDYYNGVFAAGCACGVPLTLLQNPLDVWRTRLQTSYNPGVRGSAVLRGLYADRKALLRGTSITFIRNTLGNGFFFCCYEASTRAWDSRFSDKNSSGEPDTSVMRTFLRSMACGGITGIAFNGLFHPLMTVRANMQTVGSEGTPAEVARGIYRTSGIPGFFRGVSIVLFRSAPVNAAGFGAMELAKRFLSPNDE